MIFEPLILCIQVKDLTIESIVSPAIASIMGWTYLGKAISYFQFSNNGLGYELFLSLVFMIMVLFQLIYFP